MKAEISSNKS